MGTYLWIQFFHVIGVVMMLGATFSNGVLHLGAMKTASKGDRRNSLNNILTINKSLMIPGFILIILPGFLMTYKAGYSIDNKWLLVSVVLTAILVLEFIWGYKLEKEMETLTHDFLENERADYDKCYEKVLKKAVPIGSTATLISLVVVFLMLGKPF
jgi:uncharacterized membrane protein